MLHKTPTFQPMGFSGCVQEVQNNILLKTIPVIIHGPTGDKEDLAFLDGGSTATLLDMQTARDVGIKGKAEPFCFSWTGGVFRYENTAETAELNISGAGKRLICRGKPTPKPTGESSHGRTAAEMSRT
ncbi:uncharacterized protein LOC115624589 isoform X1 [Scaptodrosophila lebanonensis]|uniref:Uncharacterized protein LOC115624589 isoform X1 n=1 Tax=Drosophila lebanonensis TaxID=7225 RepID=A0A6J2TJJ7_DROLE|nr:uncharacterized protein LOC115624589 isoform X1 [Scaptodrosophila lebanonensis]